ncbi:MAG: metalloregulator ArsR/SmtB family transcription factor [Armatimonadota bacterium]|nr:metalloregulator ArsR/SmtB family transcription factor [Armatimonadota bacterium]
MPVALDERSLKVKLFRGFSDPSRLAILEALRDGPRCVTDIAARAGLSQPNTSMHLACLEDCGLVTRQRRGQYVEYAIADPLVLDLLGRAERLLEKVGEQIFRCTRYNGRRS